MTRLTRDERAGIDFPQATWTSFDRYDRYGAIARCLRASLGAGPLRVLDVGDAAGYLLLFAGRLRLVGIDVEVQPDRLPDAVAMVGDGTKLPFADRTFDAVVSSDVLEHVPQAGRAAFIAELSRVSKDMVVLAAPFDTDGVAGVEELIRRFVLLATGSPQAQLEEHRDRCLPSLEAARDDLSAHGPVVVAGNGNLWDWLQLMLVKHQLVARPALRPLHDGIDALYNLSLAGRAAEPPFYRHLLASRRAGAVELGASTAAVIPGPDMAGIVSTLLSAAGPESTRQDIRPVVDRLLGELTETREELAAMSARLEERLTQIDGLQAELARPLRTVRAVGRRVRMHRLRSLPGEER